MYVHFVKNKSDRAVINMMRFRVVGESTVDSPLHALPLLLNRLERKGLQSYAIHWLSNVFGRFDFEIQCEFPEIEDNLIMLNFQKKVERLFHFFYETPVKTSEFMAYADFIQSLAEDDGASVRHTDDALFGYSVKWQGLAETYRFAHDKRVISKDDEYHRILHQTDKHWIAPALNHKVCPFDSDLFSKNQVVAGFDYFQLALNYRPLGDTVFHMMIIPYEHTYDLRKATPEELFELEALMRATLALWHKAPHEMAIYMQKHAQSGMTVPHLHIHVVSPSSMQAFQEDIIRQLRFFAAFLDGREEEVKSFSRQPLTADEMKRQVWRFAKLLKRRFAEEVRVQDQFELLYHGMMRCRFGSLG